MAAMILTALAVTVSATLAVHLGLTQAIAEIVLRASKCNQCTTFWLTAGVLLMVGERPDAAAAVAILFAYASNWFVLVLVAMQSLYDCLWERMQRPKSQK